MGDRPQARRGGVTAVLGVLAIAVCCGAPLLLAAVATTGAGTVLAVSGWSALGWALAPVGLMGGGWWWLRRRSVRECATTSREVTRDG